MNDKHNEVVHTIHKFFKMNKQHLEYSFMVFGSVGRGTNRPDSDIDMMVVIHDDDIPHFVLGKDDCVALMQHKIDFYRVKGISRGIDTDVQFFPMSTIRKVITCNYPILTGGTRRADGNYHVPDKKATRSVNTIKGRQYEWDKNPKSTGSRIDFTEIGSFPIPHMQARQDYVIGCSLSKLHKPLIIHDELGMKAICDRVGENFIHLKREFGVV